MSSRPMTPDMAPVVPAVAQEHAARYGVATKIAAMGLGAIATFGGANTAAAHDGPTAASQELSQSSVSSAPNFSVLGACNYPGEYGAPDRHDRAAANSCRIFGLKGPDNNGADLVIVDFTNASSKKLKTTAKELERLAPLITYGILKLDVEIMQPSEEAEQAVEEFTSSGCMDPIEAAGSETPLISDIVVEQMPELNAKPHVIAMTDAEPCHDILGYSNMRSHIDIFRANLAEMKAKILARVGLHEVLHDYQIGHIQTAGNTAMTSAKTPIESKYLTNGEFDFMLFLKKEATYGAVENWGNNLMGAINETVKTQPLDGVQLARMDWANRILGKKGAYKSPIISDNASRAMKATSKRPQAVIVPLGDYSNVRDLKLDKEDQMLTEEEKSIAWNAISLAPVYETDARGKKVVSGVRSALANTMDASQAVMGMLARDKTKKSTTVRITLPSNDLEFAGLERTAVIVMKKSTVTVRVESRPYSG